MTLVKVIDSTTWAGLTELDISESDDLSNSLVNDTYRLIHSATTALVVAAVSIVSGAPAAISLTAYAATVETPSVAVTVTSASPAAITLTAYAADVSVGGGAAYVTDDFTRANSNGLGANWTDLRDQWDIVSNQAKQTATTTSTTSVYTGVTFAADQYAQFTLAGTLSAGGVGLVLRAVDANNFIYAYCNNVNWRVYKKVGGSDTQIGSTDTTTPLAAGDVMYMEVSGNTVTLKKGGSGGTTTVTGSLGGDLSAAGDPGLNCYISGGSGWTVDDFAAGDL